MQHNNLSDRIKQFASHVEVFAGTIEKAVGKAVGDKKSFETVTKGFLQDIENLVADRVRDYMSKPVELKVKKLDHFNGELPKYESKWASGFDVRAQLSEAITLEPGERTLVPTGLSMEIPEGYEVQARPRSGLAIKKGIGLVNSPGTIDADYRGEIKIIIINLGQDAFVVEDQERIAQLVLAPVVQAQFEEVEELSDTDRGAGGFGSTGVN